MLVRPDRLDLAGQLQADRPGTDDQHPLGARELRVGGTDPLQRLAGDVGVHLGREGVIGA